MSTNPFAIPPGSMMTVRRRWTFDSAHHLPKVPEGHKCGNKHGHTYALTVHVRGPVDIQTGWVVDYAAIDDIYRKRIHSIVDHKDLNEITPNPTCEFLAWWISWTFRQYIPPHLEVARIDLQETESSGVSFDP